MKPDLPHSTEVLRREKGGEGEEDWKELLRKKAVSSKRISWILDECIRIPGTKIRFGLDPILGLLPYGGETAAAFIGAFILGEAGKKGLPIRTLLKMGGNMLLNAGVGTIPVVGDLFSFWFKSNSRNYRMLRDFLESEEGSQTKGGWWPLLLVFGFIGLVLLLNVLSWVVLIYILSQVGLWFHG